LRLRFVFWLDSTLLVLVATIEQVPFTGLSLHEWLATRLIALILMHVLFSWAWVEPAPPLHARIVGMHSLAGDERWRSIYGRFSDFFVIFAVLHLAINWEWSVAAAKRCLGLRWQ
jgi:hypothetical protein